MARYPNYKFDIYDHELDVVVLQFNDHDEAEQTALYLNELMR